MIVENQPLTGTLAKCIIIIMDRLFLATPRNRYKLPFRMARLSCGINVDYYSANLLKLVPAKRTVPENRLYWP